MTIKKSPAVEPGFSLSWREPNRFCTIDLRCTRRSSAALACKLNDQRMDKNRAHPWLVWLASVLAAAVFVIYLVHSA